MILTNPSPKGRRRQRAGKLGEAAFEAHIALIHLRKQAWLWRMATDTKVIKGQGGKLIAVPGRKSGPDYFGVLADGRALGCEVKHISAERLKSGKLASPRFPLANIERHQVDDLARIARSGGVALLVIVYGQPSLDGCFYAVPIHVVTEALEQHSPTLLSTDLEPWRVGRGRTILETNT